MTNSKWLRRALLGGVAVSVMATGAQAEDLGDLKAQIEALQSRVNELETQQAQAPANNSGISFRRGDALADWNTDRAQEGQMPAERGMTIAITPTADVPAPVTEVTVSGYVKGDFIWDFDQSLGTTFTSGVGIDQREQKDVHFSTHAQQTRFRIRSRTDTAIGQIRTLIEGHFFGAGLGFGLRHAWGEWDMTPNWTLGIGRFWRLGYDVFTGVTLVDFGGSAGAAGRSRTEQVRLTYSSGPVTFSFGLQGPSQSGGLDNVYAHCNSEIAISEIVDPDTSETACQSIQFGNLEPIAGGVQPANWVQDLRSAVPFVPGVGRGNGRATAVTSRVTNTPNLPSFGGHMLYDAPGGHQLFLGAEFQQNQVDKDVNAGMPNKSLFGYALAVGANINLGDIATFTTSWGFSEGLTSRITGGGPDIWYQTTVRTEDDGECAIPVAVETDANDNVTGATALDACVRSKYVKNRAFGGYAGLSFDVTDTTSFNVQWGMVSPSDRSNAVGVNYSNIQTVHANIIWQPVRQMRLGLEGMYGRKRLSKNYLKGYNFGNPDYGTTVDDGPDPDAVVGAPVTEATGGTDPLALPGGGACGSELGNAVCRKRTEDAFRMQFGAWFFF